MTMARSDSSFPKMPEGNWWKVRDTFKRKVPVAVTPSYLATALSMEEDSARSNIFAPLKKTGLISEDGKPTDMAYDWRSDEKYPSVCAKIIEATYPQELRDLYHSRDQDTSGLVSWFMNYARCGEKAAQMYAAFYKLLLKADPNDQEQSPAKLPQPPSSPSKRKTPAAGKSLQQGPLSPAMQEPVIANQVAREEPRNVEVQFSPVPQLHINIQLHISPETSAEQIDKIFESMTRHLKSLRGSGV
jgi:hypothetical protein